MKDNKGITMIVLIVTIIVLIILAGISITSLVDNDKSIINNAKEKNSEIQRKSLIQKIEADIYSKKAETGNDVNKQELIELLEKNNYGTVENDVLKTAEGQYEISLSEILGWENNMYVQDGLILHYDAINNTGEGDNKHSQTTTTWKDLSGKGHDGTLIGFNNTQESGWKQNCIKFDGINDMIDTGIDAKSTFSPYDNFTMEIVFNMNEVTAEGRVNTTDQGSNGAIFGAGSYGGYGIFWTTKRNITDNYRVFFTHRCNADSDAIVQCYGGDPTLDYSKIEDVQQLLKVTGIYDVDNMSIQMYLSTRHERVYSNKIPDKEGKVYPSGIIGNIKIGGYNTFGGNYKEAYSNMNVYSARIYNRALSKEEVNQNYEVDKQRFGV